MPGPDTIPGLISQYAQLLRQSVAKPEIAVSLFSTELPARDRRPCALLLTPHPDDECLTGALPLRLKQEQGWQIINIAMSLGSKAESRPRRRHELAAACAVLGFDGAEPVAGGFSKLNEQGRAADPIGWKNMAARLAEIIAHYKPQAIFMPHAQDWNATHTGVHLLSMEALTAQPADFSCALFLTEYWQPNLQPNLMIGIKAADVARLTAAVACHAGEVARNAYDRRFPAFLIDNVRRGSERLGGQGHAAADIDFAMMYEFGIWKNGKFLPSALKRVIGPQESLAELLA